MEGKADVNTQDAQGTDFSAKINNAKVNRLIKEVNWNEVINRSNNTNELFNNIHSTFCKIYDKSKEEERKHIKKENHIRGLIINC